MPGEPCPPRKRGGHALPTHTAGASFVSATRRSTASAPRCRARTMIGSPRAGSGRPRAGSSRGDRDQLPVDVEIAVDLPRRRVPALDQLAARGAQAGAERRIGREELRATLELGLVPEQEAEFERRDRKSTRLNSSHVRISYAVFCLEKKKAKDSRIIFSIPHSL